MSITNDKAFGQQGSILEPARTAFAITPSNNALTWITRALYVGTAGSLVVTMEDGTDVTFGSVAAGSLLPIRCTHVKAAGTASNIVGLA